MLCEQFLVEVFPKAFERVYLGERNNSLKLFFFLTQSFTLETQGKELEIQLLSCYFFIPFTLVLLK